MDYRMYDKGAPAGENVVELIAQHLREQGQVKTGKLILDFVGFEGTAGTTFTLNNQEDKNDDSKLWTFHYSSLWR